MILNERKQPGLFQDINVSGSEVTYKSECLAKVIFGQPLRQL